MQNHTDSAPASKKPYLRLINGKPFRATIDFDTRKEAVEAQRVFEAVLEKTIPTVHFFTRVGHGKKSVQFYCDGPETAKFIRNRFFANCQVSWTTTNEEKDAAGLNSINKDATTGDDYSFNDQNRKLRAYKRTQKLFGK